MVVYGETIVGFLNGCKFHYLGLLHIIYFVDNSLKYLHIYFVILKSCIIHGQVTAIPIRQHYTE